MISPRFARLAIAAVAIASAAGLALFLVTFVLGAATTLACFSFAIASLCLLVAACDYTADSRSLRQCTAPVSRDAAATGETLPLAG